MKGKKKLLKRMKEQNQVLVKTDKTGKIGICSMEDYEKMGLEHVSKDEEVSISDSVEHAKIQPAQSRLQHPGCEA